jgi:hypothetical protein
MLKGIFEGAAEVNSTVDLRAAAARGIATRSSNAYRAKIPSELDARVSAGA